MFFIVFRPTMAEEPIPNITNIVQLRKSHLHISIILNRKRGYQDTFLVTPHAVNPLPIRINQQKKHVHL